MATSPAAAPRASATGHQRRSTHGRTCCSHASGDTHDSAVPSTGSRTSPMPRSTHDSPSTVSASDVAAREWSASCAVTAASAPNTSPAANTETQNATRSSSGRP